MQSWLKLTWVEMKLFLREPGVYIGLVFPVALVLIIGSVYGNAPTSFFQGRGSMDVSVPAYIIMLIVANAFFALPITLVNYRERGVLFRLQATPLRPLSILSAQIGANFLLTTVEAILVILLGVVLYHLHITATIFNVVPAYILCVLSIFSVGLLIASLISSARVAIFVGIVLFLVAIYLTGIAIPLQVYPASVQNIAQFIPITHAVILLRELWLGASWLDHGISVLVLFGMLLVCLGLSSRLFRFAVS